MTAATLAAPRAVTRGAECHPVKLDWLRLTGPAARAEDARKVLESVFGATGQLSRKGYSGMVEGQSERWGDGTGVYWSAAPESQCDWSLVELTGSMLAHLSTAEQLDLASRLLALDFEPTRLDLAVDWRGECAGMGQELWQAIKRREIVGIRLPKMGEEADAPDEFKSAYWYKKETPWRPAVPTLYIGQRGRFGSGRYVRFYDKGQQTKTAPIDTWMRWETEFSDECALAVLREIIAHPDDNSRWHGLAMGAVDFRLSPGVRLDRRPRAEWWLWWLQSAQPLMAKVRRAPVCAVRKARWMAGQVLSGSLAIAREVGMKTAHEFNAALESLAEPVRASKSVLRTPGARELVRWFKESVLPPEYREPARGFLDPCLCPSGGPPG